MSSRVGYGKSGTFEVYSGYGNNTLSYFIGGVSGEYRNLKFLKPATGELKTWLEANAVKMPLTGTWVFNEKLTTTAPPLHTDVAFISNGTEFTNINTGGNLEPVKSYYLFYNDTKVNSDSAYTGKWVNSAYRTITFTQPVQYEGNEEFVRWFVDNAAPPPKPELSGTYLFNAELTVPILSDGRPLVDGTNDALSVGASPIFITNSAFECGGVSYESMGFQNNRLESKGTPRFTFIYLPVSGNDSRVYNPTIDQDDGWSDESYRTVTFTTPFPRSSNTWFYDWFIQNTTKQS